MSQVALSVRNWRGAYTSLIGAPARDGGAVTYLIADRQGRARAPPAVLSARAWFDIVRFAKDRCSLALQGVWLVRARGMPFGRSGANNMPATPQGDETLAAILASAVLQLHSKPISERDAVAVYRRVLAELRTEEPSFLPHSASA